MLHRYRKEEGCGTELGFDRILYFLLFIFFNIFLDTGGEDG
jgi:hypothetical protein